MRKKNLKQTKNKMRPIGFDILKYILLICKCGKYFFSVDTVDIHTENDLAFKYHVYVVRYELY